MSLYNTTTPHPNAQLLLYQLPIKRPFARQQLLDLLLANITPAPTTTLPTHDTTPLPHNH